MLGISLIVVDRPLLGCLDQTEVYLGGGGDARGGMPPLRQSRPP